MRPHSRGRAEGYSVRLLWSHFTEKCGRDSYLVQSLAGILQSMNTQPTENQPFPQSLREILASRGIESSNDRDHRRAKQRREGTPKVEAEATVPGIEVTYLELDPRVWEQMAIS